MKSLLKEKTLTVHSRCRTWCLDRGKDSGQRDNFFSDSLTRSILLQEGNMTGNKDENVRGVAGEGSKPVRPTCKFELFIRVMDT